MLDIEVENWKKLVIKEIVEFESVESLVSTEFVPEVTEDDNPIAGVLRWVDGLAINSSPLPLTTEGAVEKFLEGTLYWGYVSYARKKEYEREMNFQGKRVIFIDTSHSDTFKDVAKFLKTRKI